MGAKYVFNPLTGNLDTTDVVAFNGEVEAGTAAAPSVFFTGDPNTGLYSPGADQVAISTNGTGRLFIDASGNVGVNTNSITNYGASYRNFDVVGTDGAYITLKGTTTAIAADFAADGGSVYLSSKTAHPLIFRTNDSEKLRITSDGKLGLGTSTPGARLDVKGTSGTYPTQIIQHSNIDVEGELLRVARADNPDIRYHSVVGRHSGGQSVGDNYLQFKLHDPASSTTAQRAVLHIDGANRVGIGTTSPDHQLVVQKDSGATEIVINAQDGTSVANLRYRSAGSTVAQVGASGSNLLFSTGTTERARIDTSGRLLVGTSTSDSNFHSIIQTAGSGNAGTQLISRFDNNNGGATLYFAKSRSGSVGTKTIVQDGDGIGTFAFYGTDGTNWVPAATVQAVVDGTPGANDMPGRLVFSTTADGASSPTERMRIRADGTTGIAGDFITGVSTTKAQIQAASVSGKMIDVAAGAGQLYSSRDSTSSVNHFVFYNPNGAVGTIATSASATAYNTSSDYRLKENVVPLTGASDRLNQLQVHRFNFIADPATTVDGFIAHEAQAVVPECVTGTKDEVDDEGNPVYQGIDQSKLVPLLTAALQEALAEIESLKARVTALEP